ncbi:MAG: lipoyl(octanoyl) transferase LipB [Gammaproteobacteria bacterium]
MHTDTIPLHIKQRGLQPYYATWQAMRLFTQQRTIQTPDEIWLLEHPPVFTQGQGGKEQHILQRTAIPIVPIDRGGQITYHGPGQLIAYTLIDLKRLKLNVRSLVCALEKAVIDVLQHYHIEGYGRRDAPGVYVEKAKICSLGLRIRKGCAYHGLAFNINMDLAPFATINPCGYANLQVTQLTDLVQSVVTVEEVLPLLSTALQKAIRSNCDIM